MFPVPVCEEDVTAYGPEAFQGVKAPTEDRKQGGLGEGKEMTLRTDARAQQRADLQFTAGYSHGEHCRKDSLEPRQG